MLLLTARVALSVCATEQDQDRVRLLVLAAVAVLLLVGVVNLWQVVDPQQLW